MHIRSRYTAQGQYTEYTPLVQTPPSRRKKQLPLADNSLIVLCLTALFFIIIFSDRSLNKTLDPAVRDSIRKEWGIEERKHRRAMEQAHEEWSIEKRKHHRFMEQVREEEIQWNEKREEWRRKEREWQREWNEMERRAREEAERAEKEKWDREHMNLYWENIKSEDNCIAHKTRKYSAHLANLLPGIDALDACKATPLTIHGVTYDSPLYCEDRVSNESCFESKN